MPLNHSLNSVGIEPNSNRIRAHDKCVLTNSNPIQARDKIGPIMSITLKTPFFIMHLLEVFGAFLTPPPLHTSVVHGDGSKIFHTNVHHKRFNCFPPLSIRTLKRAKVFRITQKVTKIVPDIGI